MALAQTIDSKRLARLAEEVAWMRKLLIGRRLQDGSTVEDVGEMRNCATGRAWPSRIPAGRRVQKVG